MNIGNVRTSKSSPEVSAVSYVLARVHDEIIHSTVGAVCSMLGAVNDGNRDNERMGVPSRGTNR